MAKTLVIHSIPLDALKPYPENPRDNREAVEAVKQSILEFGFRIPIVVDADNVIVAGHTRVTAMKKLREQFPDDPRFHEVPATVADDLSAEQIDAFRLVDNKTANIASWDFDKLSGEVSRLTDVGFDLEPFGWTKEELDCLTNVVSADCLEVEGVDKAAYEGKSLAQHRDQQSVRISIADLAFYVLREDYDEWADNLRREHNYDLNALLDHLAEQMGLLEAKQRRTAMLEQGSADEHPDEVFDTEPVA